MVKLFRTLGTATMVVLSAIYKVIVVEVWTVNNVVEVVSTTTPEVVTFNSVEIVEATMEAKSVTVFWAIKENTLDAIIEVVDSTVVEAKVVDP